MDQRRRRSKDKLWPYLIQHLREEKQHSRVGAEDMPYTSSQHSLLIPVRVRQTMRLQQAHRRQLGTGCTCLIGCHSRDLFPDEG